MYFGVIVPSVNSVPIVPDVDIMRQVNAAIAFYDSTCNINLIFSGICHTDIPAPDAGLNSGATPADFQRLVARRVLFESESATCKFEGSFRRIIGLGAEIIVFIVQNVPPHTRTAVVLPRPTITLSSKQSLPTRHLLRRTRWDMRAWLAHVGDPPT